MNMVTATLLERIEALPFDKKVGLVVIFIILLTIFISGFGENDSYGDFYDNKDWFRHY